MEEAIKTISFKAGLMNYNEDSKLVTADQRKGVMKVQKFAGLETRFSWAQRGKENEEEFEVYMFPTFGKFVKSKQRDRVVILMNEEEPGQPDPIQFIWMQEQNSKKDDEIIKEVSEMIDDEDVNQMEEEDDDYEDVEEEDTNQMDTQAPLLSQQSNRGQANNGTNNNNSNNLNFIQQMMSQMQAMQQQGNNNNQQNQQNLLQQMMQQQQKKQSPYLSKIFTNEFLEEIAKDSDVQNVLVSELPDGQKSKEYLIENLKSPQFQQALESLDKALNSGDGAAVLMSLGLSAEAFQTTIDGNEALYQALEKYAKDQK